MFKLALRNVLRNKRRSFLTGLSIAFAVMIVIFFWTFVLGILNDMFNSYVTISAGHVRVLNSDYLRRETMMPLTASISGYRPLVDSIAKEKGVKLASGRIKFGVLMDVKGKNKPIIGVGIDPAREDAALGLSKKIVSGSFITSGTRETNVGIGLARELGLKTGDTLTVITQTAQGSLSGMNLRVAGIFNMNVASIDRRVFFLPLDQAQYLLDMDGRVTEIYVLLNDPDDAMKAASQIKATLPPGLTASPWEDNGFLYFMNTIAKGMYETLYAFVLILASFTILNTMFMAVMERTREIGMMKALGMREGAIRRLVVMESAILGTISSFIGAAAGTLLAYYISVVGLDYSGLFEKMGNVEVPLPNIYHGLFKWETVLVGFVLGVLMSVAAAIFPALRAAAMEPTEALRNQ
ncbi:MAG TPA: FtsX-like permease family protein [Candidatus Omnitrophota bacterium]|nr:FtsX-like permease family protein [Candidatus Omnitrophota bacterium]